MQVNSPKPIEVSPRLAVVRGQRRGLFQNAILVCEESVRRRPCEASIEISIGKIISDQTLVRILVVDDFAPWRQFVNSRFQGQSRFQVIGIASDGLEAVQKAEELRPDLVLMDVGLPKLNGIEAARQILKFMPDSKILFLSQNLDPDVARSALAAGAKGYVTKSDAHKELLTAVIKVVSGDQYVSRKVSDH